MANLVYIGRDGKEYTPPPLVDQAYTALSVAAQRIAANNAGPYCAQIRRDRHGNVIRTYTVTAGHRDVVDAMAALLAGDMSPDEAMTLLRRADVEQQRFGEANHG